MVREEEAHCPNCGCNLPLDRTIKERVQKNLFVQDMATHLWAQGDKEQDTKNTSAINVCNEWTSKLQIAGGIMGCIMYLFLGGISTVYDAVNTAMAKTGCGCLFGVIGAVAGLAASVGLGVFYGYGLFFIPVVIIGGLIFPRLMKRLHFKSDDHYTLQEARLVKERRDLQLNLANLTNEVNNLTDEDKQKVPNILSKAPSGRRQILVTLAKTEYEILKIKKIRVENRFQYHVWLYESKLDT